jgi:hypothetical protein
MTDEDEGYKHVPIKRVPLTRERLDELGFKPWRASEYGFVCTFRREHELQAWLAYDEDGNRIPIHWRDSGLEADPITSTDGVIAYALNRWPGCTLWVASKNEMRVTV